MCVNEYNYMEWFLRLLAAELWLPWPTVVQIWLFHVQIWLFYVQMWLFHIQIWLFYEQIWLFRVIFGCFTCIFGFSHTDLTVSRTDLAETNRFDCFTCTFGWNLTVSRAHLAETWWFDCFHVQISVFPQVRDQSSVRSLCHSGCGRHRQGGGFRLCHQKVTVTVKPLHALCTQNSWRKIC